MQNLSDETFLAVNRSFESKDIFLEHHNTVRVEVKCDMDFAEFPFDNQMCPFLLISTMSQSDVIWERAKIQWNREQLGHPDFDLQLETFDQDKFTVNGVALPVSGFYLVLSRKPSIFVSTYFIPSGLMVVISWISFVVKFEVVPGRLGLLITLLLVMNNMSNSVTSTMPKSGTLCPLVLWIQHSMLFIAAALFEYFAILYISKFSWRVKDPKAETASHIQTWSQLMDKMALVLFPLVYFSYVVFFWLRWWYWKGTNV